MRVLITGAGGQLGRELQRALASHELRPLTHVDLDITDASAVAEAIASAHPDAVVHAAALTDTARCEREPDAARAVNATGAAHVAKACARAGAAMLYVSTNEVFDGAQGTPYLETDKPAPINAYGRSKLEGEYAVRGAVDQHYIVRTAWLYGHGGENFIMKVLRAADRGDELTGVSDEIATPTWVVNLADAIARLVETSRYGVYHFTNSGLASRYQWMHEILQRAGKDVPLRSVTTAEFRASLQRGAVVPQKPAYSVLANTAGAALGIGLPDWREALQKYFETSQAPVSK
jgi:dTDP-4-dehydrorhamnose reductase